MKATVDKDALVEVLTVAQSVCHSGTDLNYLTQCLVGAFESDQQITIGATDFDISATTGCEAIVEKSGLLLLHAKRLLEIVKGLPAGQVRIEGAKRNKAVIRSGRIKTTLSGDEVRNFPDLSLCADAGFGMPAGTLLDMISKVRHTISSDPSRVQYSGAQLRRDGSTLYMTAVDGFRLARVELQQAENDGVDWSHIPTVAEVGVVIPRRAVEVLRRVLDPSEPVRFAWKDRKMFVDQGDLGLSICLIDAVFPNVALVLNGDTTPWVEVQRRDLIAATRRAARLSSHGGVMLTSGPDGLELHAFDPDKGEHSETLPASSTEKRTCRLSCAYLLEQLGVCEGDEVHIGHMDEGRAQGDGPVVIGDPDRPDVLSLIMPQQL